jgi:hypothetical protein
MYNTLIQPDVLVDNKKRTLEDENSFQDQSFWMVSSKGSYPYQRKTCKAKLAW